MNIAFVHNHKAFLPAIEAYCRFFGAYNIECEAVTKDELGLVHRQVEWFFMGTDLSKPKEGIIKIHEYTSTSIPPFRVWKDFYKSFINTQPDARIFQNEFVKKSLNIKDRQPFFYRDVGFPAEWLNEGPANDKKEFDFIYVGDLSPARKPEALLNCFIRNNLQQHTLLLLGRNYEALQQLYSTYPNIIFKGPAEKSEVKAFIQKSRFALNYVPDEKPFSHLASTKFLEYAACKVPIISTDYHWIQSFQQQYGGRYLLLSPDLSNFTWDNVTGFDYAFPDLTALTWDKQIRKSGVLEFLREKFPEENFLT